jgi:hypothetical protein
MEGTQMDNITDIVRKVENDIANREVREDMKRGLFTACELASREILDLWIGSGTTKIEYLKAAAIIYKHVRNQTEL